MSRTSEITPLPGRGLKPGLSGRAGRSALTVYREARAGGAAGCLQACPALAGLWPVLPATCSVNEGGTQRQCGRFIPAVSFKFPRTATFHFTNLKTSI